MSRIEKLFECIESNNNKILKNLLVDELLVELKEVNNYILNKIYKLVTSLQWENRIAAARIVKHLNIKIELPGFIYYDILDENTEGQSKQGRIYYQSDGTEYTTLDVDIKKQKEEIRKELGYNDRVDKVEFIEAKDLSYRKKESVKRRKKILEHKFNSAEEFVKRLENNIVSDQWYIRHGSLLALGALIKNHKQRNNNSEHKINTNELTNKQNNANELTNKQNSINKLTNKQTSEKSIKETKNRFIHENKRINIYCNNTPTILNNLLLLNILDILENDRFSDFIGETVTFPAREAAAYLLSIIFEYLCKNKTIKILYKILYSNEDWESKCSILMSFYNIKEYLTNIENNTIIPNNGHSTINNSACNEYQETLKEIINYSSELLLSTSDDVKYYSCKLLLSLYDYTNKILLYNNILLSFKDNDEYSNSKSLLLKLLSICIHNNNNECEYGKGGKDSGKSNDGDKDGKSNDRVKSNDKSNNEGNDKRNNTININKNNNYIDIQSFIDTIPFLLNLFRSPIKDIRKNIILIFINIIENTDKIPNQFIFNILLLTIENIIVEEYDDILSLNYSLYKNIINKYNRSDNRDIVDGMDDGKDNDDSRDNHNDNNRDIITLTTNNTTNTLTTNHITTTNNNIKIIEYESNINIIELINNTYISLKENNNYLDIIDISIRLLIYLITLPLSYPLKKEYFYDKSDPNEYFFTESGIKMLGNEIILERRIRLIKIFKYYNRRIKIIENNSISFNMLSNLFLLFTNRCYSEYREYRDYRELDCGDYRELGDNKDTNNNTITTTTHNNNTNHTNKYYKDYTWIKEYISKYKEYNNININNFLKRIEYTSINPQINNLYYLYVRDITYKYFNINNIIEYYRREDNIILLEYISYIIISIHYNNNNDIRDVNDGINDVDTNNNNTTTNHTANINTNINILIYNIYYNIINNNINNRIFFKVLGDRIIEYNLYKIILYHYNNDNDIGNIDKELDNHIDIKIDNINDVLYFIENIIEYVEDIKIYSFILKYALEYKRIKILKYFIKDIKYNEVIVEYLLKELDINILREIINIQHRCFNVLFLRPLIKKLRECNEQSDSKSDIKDKSDSKNEIKTITKDIKDIKTITKDINNIITKNEIINKSEVEIIQECLSVVLSNIYIKEEYNISKNMKDKIDNEYLLVNEILDSKNIKEIESDINLELREYQIEGIKWINFLYRIGMNGILADDMGLGKTVQVLAFLSYLVKENKDLKRYSYNSNEIKSGSKSSRSDSKSGKSIDSKSNTDNKRNTSIDNNTTNNTTTSTNNTPTITGRFLVICPSSLITHWYNESLKVTNNIIPLIYSKENKEYNLLIISYDTYRIAYKKLIEIEYDYIILDEGHLLRNKDTLLYKRILLLKSKNKIIVSGTPIQNTITDIYALFNIINRNYLGEYKSFNGRYGALLKFRENKKAYTDKEGEEIVELLKELHNKILPFILRRVKEDVLKEIPPKIVKDVIVELSVKQREEYNKAELLIDDNHDISGISCNRDVGDRDVSDRDINDRDISDMSSKDMNNKNKINDRDITTTTTTPSINQYKDYKKINKIPRDGLRILNQQLKICSHLALVNKKQVNPNDNSSKMKALGEILSMIEDKILIFCQYKNTIKLIIEDLLIAMNISYSILDGSVEPSERGRVVDKFNSSSIRILLLTTSIGGLGLNLTSASTVIFFEHDWNPFNDLQAMDRAHRIGQKKCVNVIRLITKNTIEERIMSLQKFKIYLASSLITEENKNIDMTGILDHKDKEIINKKKNNILGSNISDRETEDEDYNDII